MGQQGSGFWAKSLHSALLTPSRLLFDCLRYQTPHSVPPPLGQQDQHPQLNLQRQTVAQNQSSQDQLKQVIKTRQCLKNIKYHLISKDENELQKFLLRDLFLITQAR